MCLYRPKCNLVKVNSKMLLDRSYFLQKILILEMSNIITWILIAENRRQHCAVTTGVNSIPKIATMYLYGDEIQAKVVDQKRLSLKMTSKIVPRDIFLSKWPQSKFSHTSIIFNVYYCKNEGKTRVLLKAIYTALPSPFLRELFPYFSFLIFRAILIK